MAILPILMYGQPALRRKAKPVEHADAELAAFADSLVETMRGAGGIGLAANQVGALRRVLVVEIAETAEEHVGLEPLVMVNPIVLEESGNWTMEEGCLSIPEVRDEVERAETIRVRYRDRTLAAREITASGLLGRVILHEIDHLNGVLFIDYLPKTRQRLLTGRLNKIRRGDVPVSYPIVADAVETP